MVIQPVRAYRTTVSTVQKLSPHFTRFTVTAPELKYFGTAGLDQRVKLFLPREDGGYPEIGLFEEPAPSMTEWFGRWRLLSDLERNPMRTYTIRSIRTEEAQIDIDFVLHGVEGPASRWALDAVRGDQLIVIGPDARSTESGGGVEWQPGDATRVLLAGDETAVPAISAILETLPAHLSGHALLEVPTEEDILPVVSPAAIEQRWLPRNGSPHGSLLIPAVHSWGEHREKVVSQKTASVEPQDDNDILWDIPQVQSGSEYSWLAGEAGIITQLRRYLVKDLGMDRSSVAFMGYWRNGKAGA